MQMRLIKIEIPVSDDADFSDVLERAHALASELAEEFSPGEISESATAEIHNLCSVEGTEEYHEIACEDSSDEECAA